MSESSSHKRAKSRAAGRGGITEYPLSHNRRLDALSASRKRATEVEKSGTQAKLEQAARRLRASGVPQKVLQVPQQDMSLAVKAMKSQGVGGSVRNMSGTKRRSV